MPDFPVVDAHVHLYDIERLSYGWLRSVPAIDRTHLLTDFDRARGNVAVDKIVFVEVAVDPGQHLLEAEFIEEKIKNCLEFDYPKEKIQFLFVTDGSDDGTPDIVKRFTQIQLLHQPERKGKIAATNRAMPFVKTPIVVFTDANTIVNKDFSSLLTMAWLRYGCLLCQPKTVPRQCPS